jgi:alkaline phosphatase D
MANGIGWVAAAGRRQFLMRAGAGVAGLALLPGDEAQATTGSGAYPFTLGVASGDPAPHGVVLWTRLAPKPLEADGGMPQREVAVRWWVAEDERMQRVVRYGTALATPALAHSVHVEVTGLRPGRHYFYRFAAGGEETAVARTRTAPARDRHLQRLRFAFCTCQNWSDGYYNALARMAEEELDLVLHLGDYIYEGVAPDGGARAVALPPLLQGEATTLARYRAIHALYKTDPDLQRVHALFPFVVTWDDHEVENDYTGLISENGDPIDFFARRRAAAYQAFYEHLPLRRRFLQDGRLYRRLQFGDLATFHVLDGRQYRSDQPCGDGETERCGAALDPAKTMLGRRQESWLGDGLAAGRSRWDILAQQVLMAELNHQRSPGQTAKVFWNDGWDGYPLARQRLLQQLRRPEVANPVVITGDWHSTFVNDVLHDFDRPGSRIVATEFVTPAITSNGDGPVYGPYYGPFISYNPHIRFFEGDRKGYFRVDLTHRRWATDLRFVERVGVPGAAVETFRSWVVEAGRPEAQPA